MSIRQAFPMHRLLSEEDFAGDEGEKNNPQEKSHIAWAAFEFVMPLGMSLDS